MQKINYLSAPSGAGKTYVLINRICRLAAEGESVIFCQPTNKLLEDTRIKIEKRSNNLFDVKIINSNNSNHVVKDVVAFLKSKTYRPTVLLITWEAFVRVPYKQGAMHWHLFIDEIPNPFVIIESDAEVFVSNAISNKISALNYHFMIAKQSLRASFSRGLLDNSSDDERGLYYRLISSNWIVYTIPRTKNVHSKRKNKQNGELYFSILQPRIFDKFKSILISGANFTESLLFHCWKSDVIFENDEKIAELLQYTYHKNGYITKIYYAFQGNWSKYIRNKSGLDFIHGFLDKVKEVVGDSPLIWAANKDVNDSIFKDFNSAYRIAGVPHGLNEYSSINNVVFLAAQNLSPPAMAFLSETLGLKKSQIVTAVHREAAYQAIMRCSLRDIQNSSEKNIFVPDSDTASWLAEKLPESTVIDLQLDESIIPKKGKIGRTRKYESNTERKRAFDSRKKEELEKALDLLKDKHTKFDKLQFDDDCNENTIYKIDSVTSFKFSFAKSFSEAKNPYPISMLYPNFLSLLRRLYMEHIPSKDRNIVMYPSLFEKKDLTTFKALENISYCWGVWLDIENGDMNPEDFSSVFPYLTIIAFSTFSSTKEKPRYRIIIPTTTTHAPETYREICKWILEEVEKGGFPAQKSVQDGPPANGIDRTKLGPTDAFFAPCRPADPEASYFQVFKGKGRKPLDVAKWLESQPTEATCSPPMVPDEGSFEGVEGQVNRERVQKAIQDWREVAKEPGKDNANFFKLAKELERCGLDIYERNQILDEEASYARKPDDRRRQIKSIK